MQEIFQYRNGTGILHRMNPLTKIGGVTAVVVLAVLTADPLFLAVMTIAIAFLGAIGGVGRDLARQVPLLTFLGGFLVLITVLTLQSGAVVLNGPITVTAGALSFGLALALRFCAMIFAFQILVATTLPTALVSALRRLGFPADYALMALVALRFIPHLQIEGRKIQEAQAARGFAPGTGIGGRVRGTVPVLVPLIANALGKAEVIGLTIDLRGLRHRLSTTGTGTFGRPDLLLAAGVSGLLACFLVLAFLA
ncbi:energy-coupling factor transporter transmembrane component T family protein [Methanofollis fontis]|uniref:Energy-coupling factor transporter transmembrane protein EcfT n=1 Tax=Methanofollis fontis TaxID=2052832 RepID=A0A483CRB9_9EURY|nr:energy-coupling factor transporter transmembrane component T [Methanofollis fontis]TAJ43544.1 energy-coupling factor transporter transmembrane protein EcfT [Methanofollis fontis]